MTTRNSTRATSRPAIINDDQTRRIAQLFSSAAEPVRLALIQTLQDGERCVTDICSTLRLPQPTVSHHLGLLRMGGIVSSSRRGKQVFYRLSDTDGKRIVRMLKAAA